MAYPSRNCRAADPEAAARQLLSLVPGAAPDVGESADGGDLSAASLSLQEAYIQGISTRSVDELVKALGVEGVSKSQVSHLCEQIDERVHTFLDRPIEDDWPYIWLDASYVKARRDHHILSAAIIVAIGVNTDDRREVLGMIVGHSEAEPFWVEFLRGLTRRGLRSVKLVVSDAHKGLKAAIIKVLSATWQGVACISCATP